MVMENAAGLTLSAKPFSATRPEPTCGLRDLGRQRNREIEFSALSQQEMDKLCTVDEYPSDSFLFTAYGYALHIEPTPKS